MQTFIHIFSLNRTRLSSEFDILLSEKLQGKGLKCWLQNKNNCFRNPNNKKKTKYLWRGKYVCIDKKCLNSFTAHIINEKLSENIIDMDEVSIRVLFKKKFMHLGKIQKKIRCSGKKRNEQKFVLCSDGLTNTLCDNVLFNSISGEDKGSLMIKF